jgi:hypothetical protein
MMADERSEAALVCLIRRPAELERVRQEGWYRIPISTAPRQLAVACLAFYQSAAFGPERWSIRWVAPVLSLRVARRVELLPEEASHPRAQASYYCYTLGPLEALAAPIRARRLRRLAFIPTTVAALDQATDVSQLWRLAAPTPPDVWGAGIGRRAVRR